MKNPFKFLSKNKGLSILIVAALLLQLISSIQYFFTKNGIEEEARKLAEIRLENANILVEVAMSSVEVAINNVSRFVTTSLKSPQSMGDISYAVMEANTSIAECGMLFEPDYFGPRFPRVYHSSTHRIDGDGLERINHSLEADFDYYTRQWYSGVKQSGKAVWTDPYVSRSDGKLVCTYSTPLIDDNGSFAGVFYADISMEWLRSIVEAGASAYPNAFSVILNKLGEPVVDTRQDKIPGAFSGISAKMQAGVKGEEIITYDDTTSYAFFSPIGKHGWSMAIVCPEKDMFYDFYRVSRLLMVLMLLGLVLLGFIMYRAARNFMKLRKVESSRQRMEGELAIAHGIQMGMIPKIFPPYPERDDIEIYASLTAAKEVGGDLYDFFISDEKLWFCIGDVSGKGVPASLVMAVTRSLFRTNAMHLDSPGKVMCAINDAMAEMNENNMFVTMFIGRLDLASGNLAFCNAGHNAPVKLHDGEAGPIAMRPNLPVALFKGFKYEEEQTELGEKDGFFLYTDGLTEAENPQKELFGEDRMLEVLRKYSIPMDVVLHMTDAVTAHANGAEQSDDLTMLSLRYKGIPNAHLTIRNDINELSALPAFVEGLGLDEKTSSSLNLALEEAVTNAVLYAFDTPGTGVVDIHATIKDHMVRIVLSDSGKPFDPTKAAEPDITLSGDERPIGGLGIFLIRKLMDKVSYERKEGKNVLVMAKNLEYDD